MRCKWQSVKEFKWIFFSKVQFYDHDKVCGRKCIQARIHSFWPWFGTFRSLVGLKRIPPLPAIIIKNYQVSIFYCRYGNCEDGCVKTPALWLGTKGGSVPFLTAETFEISGLKSQTDMFAGLLVPFKDHVRSVEVYKKFEKGKSKIQFLKC